MVGCDIIEIERIQSSVDRLGSKFVQRILTDREIEIYERRGSKIAFLAGRFAAKEAVSKAFKIGIGTLGWHDIEVLNSDSGAPEVFIRGEKSKNIEISISHSRDYAVSVCVKNGEDR